MFLRRNMRNFESNIKVSFLAVKKDMDNLNKFLELNKNEINENNSNFEVLRKNFEIFREDTEEALVGLTKSINNLKEDSVEVSDHLSKDLSEIKKLIELKAGSIKEIKSEFNSELKSFNKKLVDIEDKVKILKPKEELSVEQIFKEETKGNKSRIIIGVIVVVIIIALIIYGLISSGVI